MEVQILQAPFAKVQRYKVHFKYVDQFKHIYMQKYNVLKST